MEKPKVILDEIKGLVDLSVSEILGSSPILKVIVVCLNVKEFQETFQELSPIFQRSNNCKHFVIPDFLVTFSRIHSLGSEDNRVP